LEKRKRTLLTIQREDASFIRKGGKVKRKVAKKRRNEGNQPKPQKKGTFEKTLSKNWKKEKRKGV